MLEIRLLYRSFLVAALVTVALHPGSALAQSLDQLRASGAVGERFDGYVQALSPSAKATVQQVNQQRKQIYQQRAAEQNVSVDQIGRVYAEQIMANAPPGTRFLKENGDWVTK